MIRIHYEPIIDSRLLWITKSSCQVTTISECDLIIHHELLWSDFQIKAKLISISKKYKAIDKFVIVFIVDDYEGNYAYYHNLLLIRTSLRASKRKKNEFTLPYIWEGNSNAFEPAKFLNKPAVGFCGQITTHRKELIETFQKSSEVYSDFIIRENFWGGAPHNVQIVEDFRANMIQNPFNLAQRGSGNFSMRFYQTLSYGRIPVLIDTDMLLPFSNKIDWDKYIVFEKTANACLKKIISVFKSGAYLSMQQECFTLYKNFFSDETFFDQLVIHIIMQYYRPSMHSVSQLINFRLC